MGMKNKYVKPEIEVIDSEPQVLLAGSDKVNIPVDPDPDTEHDGKLPVRGMRSWDNEE